MEDVLTEIPPPSRFFQEDLNNFIPHASPLPSPFLILSKPKPSGPLRASLLIIALSSPSLYIFHHIRSKNLIGSLIIPETPLSGISLEPCLSDKSCNIYTLNNPDSSILLVSVQSSVAPERCRNIAKMLIGEQLIPERVLILSSVQSQNFRGRLSADEPFVVKLETSRERNDSVSGLGDSSLLKDLEYFPSGSMMDGLAAALLSRCEMRNIKGTLCVSWPEFDSSVVSLLKSILHKNVLPSFNFSSSSSSRDELRSSGFKDHSLDSDLYA